MIDLFQIDDARSRKMFNNNNTSSSVHAAKQEGDSSNHEEAAAKYTTSTSARQWAGFKNPRIVRVSKAFGGKDRHSKVCTVKGLRDRRIRLSVPTAIQLYDLQDRLGLNQPSKVIDWLIDSTKDDIDKLPPLGQMLLPGDLSQFHYPVLPATTTLNISQDLNSPQVSFSHQFLGSTTPPNITTFVKDVGNRTLLYTKRDSDHDDGDHERKKGKEALLVENEEENGDGNGGLNFFPIPHQYSSYPAGLMFPYINPYYNWEPPSNLSQFGNQGVSSHQTHDSSSSCMAASASQFLLYPPPPPAAAMTPNNSPFPPLQLNIPNLGENHDHPIIRQNNQFHLLSSSSQHHVPPANSLMPLFNLQSHDPQEKAPFGFDAQPPKAS